MNNITLSVVFFFITATKRNPSLTSSTNLLSRFSQPTKRHHHSFLWLIKTAFASFSRLLLVFSFPEGTRMSPTWVSRSRSSFWDGNFQGRRTIQRTFHGYFIQLLHKSLLIVEPVHCVVSLIIDVYCCLLKVIRHWSTLIHFHCCFVFCFLFVVPFNKVKWKKSWRFVFTACISTLNSYKLIHVQHDEQVTSSRHVEGEPCFARNTDLPFSWNVTVGWERRF